MRKVFLLFGLMLGFGISTAWAEFITDPIIPSTSGNETIFYIKCYDGKYFDSNTSPTTSADDYGEFAFYKVNGVDNAYYIKCIDTGKWLTYDNTATGTDGKGFVTFSDTQDNYFNLTLFRSGSYMFYKIRPYNDSGEPNNYLNWHGGTNGYTQTIGLWNAEGGDNVRYVVEQKGRNIVTDKDNISSLKSYFIFTTRGCLTVKTDGSGAVSQTNSSADNDAEAWKWAFIASNGKTYLYSLKTKKFLKEGNNLVSNISDATPIAIEDLTNTNENCLFKITYSGGWLNNNNSGGFLLVNYQSEDSGNKLRIKELGDISGAGTVSSLSDISNNMVYTLTSERGGVVLNKNGNGICSSTNADGKSSSGGADLWALLTFNGNKYFYNIAAKKFLRHTNSLSETVHVNKDVMNMTNADSPQGDYKFKVKCGSNTLNNNNGGGVALDSWNTEDPGNRLNIVAVYPFDDTGLEDLLVNTVTFTIEDADGNQLRTVELDMALDDYNVSPSADNLGCAHYYTLTPKAPYTVSASGSNTATIVATSWNGPFTISPSLDNNGAWYALNVRNTSIGLVTSGGEMKVTTNYGVNDVLDDDMWAFYGNNVNGFSVYNKKSGLYLTKPADDNGGTPCTLSSTPNTDWLVMPTANASTNANGSFLLYEKSNVAHKLNQYGGASSAKLAYYNSDTDPGNFFYLSTSINFVKNVIEDMLTQTVYGLVYSFPNAAKQTTFQTRYDNLASSEILGKFTTLYNDMCNAQIQPTTGWYQIENLYVNNNFLLEAAADGQLIGKQTITDGANDINTFVKYDATSGLMSLQGQYIPLHTTDASVASLSDTGGKLAIAQIGNTPKTYLYFTETTESYNKLYLNYGGDPYTLRSYSTQDPSNCQWYIHPKTSFTIKMNPGESKYWATLYAPFGVELPTGTEAYTGVVSDNKITLTTIGQNVPANTPVVLCGNAANITANINDAIPAINVANDLRGQNLAHTTAKQTDKLSLGISGGKVGFYVYDDTIGANKAYLPYGGNSSNGFQFVFDDVTGLNNIVNISVDGQLYDLQGRKVVAPAKGGLYIKGGKVVKY